MLNFGNKEFRNIVQQVAKNKADIADILTASRVLGEFGIKVVGQVDSVDDLPTPAEYEGSYGDAYIVGTETPYSFYIFTRPSESNPEPHWFGIGQFPLPGPQGVQGPAGPQGVQGVPGLGVISKSFNPTATGGYEPGQLWINTLTGDVWQLFEGSPNYWDEVSNIMGPQGVRGLKGDRGDRGLTGATGPVGPQGPAGQSIIVKGQVATTNSLPDPTVQDPGTAFLVGGIAPFDLYLIVGESLSTQQWLNAGVFNNYNYVEVSVPVDAIEGQLSEEQYNELISSPYNNILINGEYYRLNDDKRESGYLVYTHVGSIGNNMDVYIKALTLNSNNYTFVITEFEAAREAMQSKHTLLANGWVAAKEGPFNYKYEVADDKVWRDANVALLTQGIADAKYGIALGSWVYSTTLNSGVFTI